MGEVESGVERYAESIARAPRRGDVENLLATELAMATNSVDPLLKIRHILEAFMLLTSEEKERIASSFDLDRLKRVYDLTLSLLQITPTHDSVHVDRALIPLPFAPDKGHEYLDFLTIKWDLSSYFKKNYKEGNYYSRLTTFLTSGEAPLGMCLTVKSLFVANTLPWTLEILRRIFTSFVSPDLWKELTTSIKTGSRRTKP